MLAINTTELVVGLGIEPRTRPNLGLHGYKPCVLPLNYPTGAERDIHSHNISVYSLLNTHKGFGASLGYRTQYSCLEGKRVSVNTCKAGGRKEPNCNLVTIPYYIPASKVKK